MWLCGFALLRSGRVACPWVPCGRSQPRAHAQPHVATDHATPFSLSRVTSQSATCLASLCNFLSLVVDEARVTKYFSRVLTDRRTTPMVHGPDRRRLRLSVRWSVRACRSGRGSPSRRVGPAETRRVRSRRARQRRDTARWTERRKSPISRAACLSMADLYSRSLSINVRQRRDTRRRHGHDNLLTHSVQITTRSFHRSNV